MENDTKHTNYGPQNSTQRTVINVDENLSPCFRQPPTFRISTFLLQHNSRKYIYLKSFLYIYFCAYLANIHDVKKTILDKSEENCNLKNRQAVDMSPTKN